MKQVQGIWLPDGDTHFARMMKKEPARVYCGKPVGVYQHFKIEKALGFVDHRRTALDIGAHVGFWSMWLASEFESVYAFEPSQAHAECFSRNVVADNFMLYPFAVGSRPSTSGMTLDPENSGKACLSEGSQVQIVTIDSFDFQDVDLIKIDVEGYESEVLEGARETIKRCGPVVVFEDNGQHERYGFKSPHAVAKSLGLKELAQMGKDWIYQC